MRMLPRKWSNTKRRYCVLPSRKISITKCRVCSFMVLMTLLYFSSLILAIAYLVTVQISSPDPMAPNTNQIKYFQDTHQTKCEESSIKDGIQTNGILDRMGAGTVTSECRRVTFPVKCFRGQTWQRVGPTNAALVFSAYHDERRKGVITIVGISASTNVNHFCQLWYQKDLWYSAQMVVTEAKGEYMHRDIKKYRSMYIYCYLPDDRVPDAVSLVAKSGCRNADNILHVQNIPIQNYTRRFTVCLSPLNFRYGRAYELVEWIELNRILGADYFVVYNYSSAVNVQAVLQHYTDLGIVEVVQWPLPVNVDRWPRTKDVVEIHYFAQTAALNDCLLRSKGVSEYVVNADLDEFIIPHLRNVFTWSDVIDAVGEADVYMFMNTYFRKEWTDNGAQFDEKQSAVDYHLITLLHVLRENKIDRPLVRSKYIARTSTVNVMLTHQVMDNPPIITSNIHPNLALLHHYRNLEQYNDTELTNVYDKTVIQKYSGLLVNKVSEIWSLLRTVEMDIPID